jgi:hypothetical protein
MAEIALKQRERRAAFKRESRIGMTQPVRGHVPIHAGFLSGLLDDSEYLLPSFCEVKNAS